MAERSRSHPIAAVSGDGRRMVKTASPEGCFEVWDLVAEELLLTFQVELPDYAYFERVVMDSRGEKILLAISDATGALVCGHDGRQLHRLQRPQGPSPHMTYTRGATLSDDGSLAALGINSDCYVFCTRTGAMLRSFGLEHPGDHRDVFPLSWKGRLAYRLPSRLLKVARWLPQPIPFFGGEITCLDISGCNRYLFAACESYFYREWEIVTGKLVCDNWSSDSQKMSLPGFSGQGGVYGYQCDVRLDASFRPAALRAQEVLVDGFRYDGVTFQSLSPPYEVLAKISAGEGQILAAGVLDGRPLVVRLENDGRIEVLRDLNRIRARSTNGRSVVDAGAGEG